MAHPLQDKKRRKDERRRRPAMRPFWSGTVTFGLVSVPVNLYPAARRGGVSLRMLSPNGNPLSRRYYCPADGQQVERDHLIRGYEIERGRYVLVDDTELERLAPRKSRDIDLQRFVPQAQIPPEFFDRAYYLTPSGDTNKAYRLLAELMEATGRAGLATFVMRGKEYLVAILAERGILRAETLRFEKELRRPEDIGLEEPGAVEQDVIDTLAALLRQHTATELPLEALEDRAAMRLQEIIEAKWKRGEDVVQSAAEAEMEEDEEAEGVDLLEVIRESLRVEEPEPAQDRAAAGGRLARLSKSELYNRAQQQNIPGRSKMSKQQLIRALRRR